MCKKDGAIYLVKIAAQTEEVAYKIKL